LINNSGLANVVKNLNNQLFEILKETNGMYLPFYKDDGNQSNLRNAEGSREAKFPAYLKVNPKKQR